ncbi:MAG TPA: lamin tail domain-containing protein, partial [Clostridia bacterium]|nr:lamin tail domain-containing protein [Clostridia bacterium]
MRPKRLTKVICILSTIYPLLVTAQVAEHLEVTAASGDVLPGSAISLSIKAVGLDQLPLTNWAGLVRLAVILPQSPTPVISEINRYSGAIEVANPRNEAVDMTGWELHVISDYSYYGADMVAPVAQLHLPPNSVLAPGAAFTWTDQGVPPGSFPAFVSAKPFAGSGYKLVRLFNTQGTLVDEVYLSSHNYAPSDALWQGLGVAYPQNNLSNTRIGTGNHFWRDDWATATPGMGVTNTGLALPWTNTSLSSAVSPAVIQVTNGLWTGLVTIPEARAGLAWIKADDNAGTFGQSAPFTIFSRPSLTLDIPPSVLKASEGQPGLTGYVTVAVPQPVTTDLIVSLIVSAPDEFRVPSQVVIPAGSQSASFPVTNFDDALADGTAVVTLAASAPGFTPASTTLLNEDNEQGALYVCVPFSVKEGCGFGADPGRVFLDTPALHDVFVQLEADPLLEVSASVTIPAGHASASFRIRVGDDALVNPNPFVARVRAQTGVWQPGIGVVTIQDDENRNFSLNLPATVLEGTTNTGQILFQTPRQLDTVLTITSADPRLLVPAQVTVPAGALGVDFSLQATNNSFHTGHTSVNVCAQTAGQAQICSWVTVMDDEVDIRSVVLGQVPSVVLSGVPFRFAPSLVDYNGQVQLTNLSGVLDLLGAGTLAEFAPGSSSIQFTNGAASTNIVINGAALGVQLRLAAGGMVTNTPGFDVLSGGQLALFINDAVWNPFSGRFLLAEPAQTNAAARLTEFDPASGTLGRHLDLPRSVQRIAL